jgi:hypothetical protein
MAKPQRTRFDMSDDTKNDTERTHPINEPPPLVIPRGGAQLALSQALDQLTIAYERLEGVAMACARALDGAS